MLLFKRHFRKIDIFVIKWHRNLCMKKGGGERDGKTFTKFQHSLVTKQSTRSSKSPYHVKTSAFHRAWSNLNTRGINGKGLVLGHIKVGKHKSTRFKVGRCHLKFQSECFNHLIVFGFFKWLEALESVHNMFLRQPTAFCGVKGLFICWSWMCVLLWSCFKVNWRLSK